MPHTNFLESVPDRTPHGNKNPSYKKNFHWENCVKNQNVDTKRYYKPGTLEELVKIIKTAVNMKQRVRAVASGHSFTEILQANDFMVDTHSMDKPIELDKNLLKEGDDTKFLVHVENGIRLRKLNQYLDSKKLALYNMGAYDMQTILGVISTSTHGTGVTLGPVANSVASIILAGEDGQIYRIESKEGITDPDKYEMKYPGNILIQDDDIFNSVLVSMGCMGIIYSVILKVRERFYLKEDRDGDISDTHWTEVKKRLIDGSLIAGNKHLEVWINPYEIKGYHRCLVTKRNEIADFEFRVKNVFRRARNWLQEFIAGSWIGDIVTRGLFYLFPKHSPFFIDMSMKIVIQKKPYANKSFKVMNLGAANNIKGFASDYGLSLEERDGIKHFILGVDKILANADEMKNKKGIYHSAPFSLRFVNKSNAFLSMMHGEPKCMIEIPMLVCTRGGYEILDGIENEMFKIRARPHWGQYNKIPDRKGLITDLYPEYDKWIQTYKKINNNGTFDNSFTEKCGFRN